MRRCKRTAGPIVLLALVWGLLLGAACAYGAEGEAAAPDPSLMLTLVPEAAKAGPPPIIKAGTRLTYFCMTASIPGAYKQLVQDPHGRWVDRVTGLRYSREDVPSGSGAGYNVVQVGYVDAKVAQLSTRFYTLDTATKTCTFALAGGLVGHSGCAGYYWIHPDVLKAVPEVNRDGLCIARTPYPLNGRTYKAIRIQIDSPTGYQAHVYDLANGLLIFSVSRAQGPACMGQGSTRLATEWIVESKDLDVPWKDALAPAWVNQFQQLTYQGAQTTSMPSIGSKLDRPMTVVLAPKARGRNWLRFTTASSIQNLAGLPPEQNQADGACGGASIGGLWLPPQGLAALKQGQVLDRNDVVGTTTSVTQADGPVMLSEIGPHHRTDYTYDPGSGILSAISISQQVGLANIALHVQLTRKP